MVSIRPNPIPVAPDGMPFDDAVWAALNDASRRKILDLLREKSMTTKELCEYFDFSRFAVMKHLKTLHRGGLIIVERRGRERVNHLNPVPLQTMYRRWIRPFEQIPADRLLHLKSVAESITEK